MRRCHNSSEQRLVKAEAGLLQIGACKVHHHKWKRSLHQLEQMSV